MRMRMRVANRWYMVQGSGDIEQCSLQRTRRHRRDGLRQHRKKKRERMGANADCTADEQDSNQTGAECLKLSEAEWVSSSRRPTG
jgi:hypothetical protein